MGLVIRKTVDLSSLGQEYQNISLQFNSIPAKDLGDLDEQREKLSDKLKDALAFFLSTVEKYFISGKQGDTEIKKEDLSSLPEDSLIYCFKVLTGQVIDPKAENSSTNISSTDQSEA